MKSCTLLLVGRSEERGAIFFGKGGTDGLSMSGYHQTSVP